ncbi:ribosome maturation factor RimP [Tepiditoga spiralis]|nr:ribosome maturation factor [Tepiditoga spiralis]
MDTIKEKIFKKAEEFAKEMNLEIFDIKINKTKRKNRVEIIIDKLEKYVGIEDCRKFSVKIEPWFDEEDLFNGSYDLIVSSPGLDRPLRGINDYKRFKGKLAKFYFIEKVGNKTSLIAFIEDILDDELLLKTKNNKKYNIKIKNIKNSNLEIDF